MLVRWPTWRACWPARADSLPQLASTAGEESTGSTYAGLRSACGASRPAGLRSLALVQLRPQADGQRVHPVVQACDAVIETDRKSTRLNSSHVAISYAVFCLKK